uniref:Uncharacterized protein n=1 Tax=Babesia bovis TaxID=5865 RepID=S6BIA6_BABBO|nr:hypothetical protein [Babesia bovis]
MNFHRRDLHWKFLCILHRCVISVTVIPFRLPFRVSSASVLAMNLISVIPPSASCGMLF